MPSIKGEMKTRGVGSMLRVQDILLVDPACKDFDAVVIAGKPAPKGARNAAFSVVVDYTPAEAREIGINVTNAKRIMKFLEDRYGSDDYDMLKDHVIRFELRKVAGYDPQNPNEETVALEVAEILGADPNVPPMQFDAAGRVVGEEPKPALNIIPSHVLRRQQLEQQRKMQAAETKAKASTAEPDWMKPGAARKSRGRK